MQDSLLSRLDAEAIHVDMLCCEVQCIVDEAAVRGVFFDVAGFTPVVPKRRRRRRGSVL